MEELGPPVLPLDDTLNFPSRAVLSKQMLHLPDWRVIDLPDHERAIHELIGLNSVLYLPLVRNDEGVGLLVFGRFQPRAFSAPEIALAESFRDQAMIAIENVRLFTETQQSLERQTATAEILRVISSSHTDVQPVFEAIVDATWRVVSASRAFLMRRDGPAHRRTVAAAPKLDVDVDTTMFSPKPIDPAGHTRSDFFWTA